MLSPDELDQFFQNWINARSTEPALCNWLDLEMSVWRVMMEGEAQQEHHQPLQQSRWLKAESGQKVLLTCCEGFQTAKDAASLSRNRVVEDEDY
jgi:hypothetical protein